jgi:uncharacterized protein YjbI with pentapeptide repeats
MAEQSNTTPPPWSHCAAGASTDDPVGCRGVQIPGQSTCLAHASAADKSSYITGLAPGTNLDLRGTHITRSLLQAILGACHDPNSVQPRLGDADFDSATFTGPADFVSATFTGPARFVSATFTGPARFVAATFNGDAWFDGATFNGDARFDDATFTGDARFFSATFAGDAGFVSATFTGYAWFDSATVTGDAGFDSATFSGPVRFGLATFSGLSRFGSATFTRYADFVSATFNGSARFGLATFTGDASFDEATFTGNVGFGSATFTGDASFDGATFTGDAGFVSANFEGLQHLGPLRCEGALIFDQARFTGTQVTLEAAATSISCSRAVFAGSLSARLRYAQVSLSGTTLGAPTALQSWPAPFNGRNGPLDESQFMSTGSAEMRLLDLEGVDVAQLVLTDVDLSQCRFAGAFHLDQIQMGLGCRFAEAPRGWRRAWGVLLSHWSRRKVVAEEHHWRALAGGTVAQGWTPGPAHPRAELTPGPDDLAGIYQRLRKAFEDAGDEPGAADFYYGEMEMRRNDRRRPRAERGLLWLYWLLSGYGLRASRALGWLLAAMATTVLVLLLVGLPNADPTPQITGSDRGGQVQLATTTPDPVLTLPVGQRFTTARAQKAALVVVNSVVFRSSGQNLTGWGTVVEMLSRISEPVLLGLAALAIRGRVKR